MRVAGGCASTAAGVKDAPISASVTPTSSARRNAILRPVVLHRAQICRELGTVREIGHEVIVRRLEDPGEASEKLLFVINGFGRPLETTLTLAGKVRAAEDIWNGGKVAFTPAGGASKVTLGLKPYDTRILLITGD